MSRKTIEQVEKERDEYHAIAKDLLELICDNCDLRQVERIVRNTNLRRDSRKENGSPEVIV